MKVEFYCNNGANCHSGRTEIVDLVEDWSYTPEECAEMSEQDIQDLAQEWANNFLELSCIKVEG